MFDIKSFYHRDVLNCIIGRIKNLKHLKNLFCFTRPEWNKMQNHFKNYKEIWAQITYKTAQKLKVKLGVVRFCEEKLEPTDWNFGTTH